ncbi:YciI family protein [Devosia rhodophyticola]|uniref:YciI family protein n=1 Tax=Devosia rhodophyticola TaxID=3026423 RepID=A0ABY7YUH5_9HYPH|nr:YciI family protein [Devosia rhodophyticola]WDR04961.1 YciI family protein [Devosia rhodophyticola]
MANYVLAYHGGKMPDTPEEGAKVMEQWNIWIKGLGDSMVDPGNPVGKSKTVSANGISNDGGSNPLSGFSIVKAESIDEAIEFAKGCPQLDGGTIEVAEIIEM